eukprot:7739301-Prorocentrum_lima.AAC.1
MTAHFICKGPGHRGIDIGENLLSCIVESTILYAYGTSCFATGRDIMKATLYAVEEVNAAVGMRAS